MGGKPFKNIFISSIHQNAGKTTVCLGLHKALIERGLKTTFLKPIGQEVVAVGSQNVDKDSYLISQIYHRGRLAEYMSPVTIGRGYTEHYIFHPDKSKIQKPIEMAFKKLSRGKDAIIVEGTGHSGVGSVIDFSNADVARLLGSRVIIISGGGIGRAIDEIMLNKALFDLRGVEVIGVIINKVRPDKFEKISRTIRRGLANKGVRLLGVLPEEPLLSAPTVDQVQKRLSAQTICGHDNMHRRVNHTIVAAMEPHNMIGYLRDHTLVITSGDRVDNILLAVSSHLTSNRSGSRVSGIILTGKLQPNPEIITLLKNSRIPVLICDDDTYTVAAKLENLICKIQKSDKDKIQEASRLVKKHVDVEAILAGA
jgi:BioD-like phosphotransacetylase family protein